MTAQASTGLVQENQAFGRFLQKCKRQAGSYSQLLKLRINIMVVASAWCGAHLAAVKYGAAPGAVMWNALAGIGMVAAGTAAVNQIMEREPDAQMHRTRNLRWSPARFGLTWASVLSTLLIFGGTLYLGFITNWLTGLLTFFTCVMYLPSTHH